MLVACLLAILSVDEITSLRGRFFGSKNIARTRREVTSLFDELGGYQERAYHMNIDQFNDLHQHLLPQLEEEFF